MRSTMIALAVATVSVLGPTTPVFAQQAKVARGTITAIAAQSVTVKVGDQDLKFNVDSKTMVEARGASTKSNRATAAGKPGPQLAEVLQTGQSVSVTYNEAAGALHATGIKVVPKSVASAAPADAALSSNGTVKALGADWITISGSGGSGASFEQTFKINTATRVFAKGGTTATVASGGRVAFEKLIATGDHVSVDYHKDGDALWASQVRVTMKVAKASH